jgi:hypothetical protein
MSHKELNKPMNREQLDTPRELTVEELDIVTGGAQFIGSAGPPHTPPPPPSYVPAPPVHVNSEDGNNQGENNQDCTTHRLFGGY